MKLSSLHYLNKMRYGDIFVPKKLDTTLNCPKNGQVSKSNEYKCVRACVHFIRIFKISTTKNGLKLSLKSVPITINRL
jgi:hypothetical protein